MKQKLRKGYINKTDFCKNNNISIFKFNNHLLINNYFKIYNKQKVSFLNEKFGKKYSVFVITNNVGMKIINLHGNNQSGSYQYSIKFLNELFKLND